MAGTDDANQAAFDGDEAAGRLRPDTTHAALAASAANAAEVVTVHHLVKRYGRLLAVNDVSLSIREGEIFGIIGPNGAGKTTCVECISGLRAPDAGTISVCGFSPQKASPAAGERPAAKAQGGRGGAALRLILLEPPGSR